MATMTQKYARHPNPHSEDATTSEDVQNQKFTARVSDACSALGVGLGPAGFTERVSLCNMSGVAFELQVSRLASPAEPLARDVHNDRTPLSTHIPTTPQQAR